MQDKVKLRLPINIDHQVHILDKVELRLPINIDHQVLTLHKVEHQ